MLILGLRIYKLDCPSYQNPVTGFYMVIGQQTGDIEKMVLHREWRRLFRINARLFPIDSP
ncbi:hypothetical protein [Sphingobacterium sp. LRF_L2]|uniref:hypothetical protein n=1 Tax=Sphingobacterium sp. LRF_L2 TaxID=3369421 RepID=UPI003F5FDBC0